jgi:hypothetical protein
MESRTVEPEVLELSEEEGVSDALREAVEEEIDFLEDREVKLVRMRADDEGDVFQITIHAGDEMYRMSEVAPGHVSRTVFRDPEKDGAMPYQEEAEKEEETEEETGGKEADGEGDTSEEDDEGAKEEPGSEGKGEKTGHEENGEVKDEESGDQEDTGEKDEDEQK